MPKPRPKRYGRPYRRLRLQVLERDGYICWMDGMPGATTVDHIVPLSLGGTNTADNLRAAHDLCNKRRGNGTRKRPRPHTRRW